VELECRRKQKPNQKGADPPRRASLCQLLLLSRGLGVDPRIAIVLPAKALGHAHSGLARGNVAIALNGGNKGINVRLLLTIMRKE